MYCTKKILPVFCLCLLSLMSLAQDQRVRLIGLETGIDAIGGPVVECDCIRGETATYYGDVTKNLKGMMYKMYGGAKVEMHSRNNKFGLSAGLRYTRMNSSLGKSNEWDSPSDFFYFMTNQTETSIEYLKVREINQASDYLGIPISLVWYPFKQKLFTLYFRGGLEFDYRLKTKTTVSFVDNAMDLNSDEVIEKLDDPSTMVSILSTSAGVKIGRGSKTAFKIEIGPSFFLNQGTSSLVEATAGFGTQLNIQIPF